MVTNLKRLFKKDLSLGTLSLQPILPFKQYNDLNTLGSENLAELLSFSEQRQFPDLCPEPTGKRVLFFSRRSTAKLLANIPTDQASLLVNYQIGDVPLGNTPLVSVSSPNRPNVYTLKGTFTPLPFRPRYFDILLLPFASSFGNEVLDHLSSLAGLLGNGGRAVIAVVHPTFEIFLTNQNPSSKARADSSLQAYFTALRDHDLYLETLLEGVINRENKTFFLQGEALNAGDDILGIPLVLFMRVVKYIKS